MFIKKNNCLNCNNDCCYWWRLKTGKVNEYPKYISLCPPQKKKKSILVYGLVLKIIYEKKKKKTVSF